MFSPIEIQRMLQGSPDDYSVLSLMNRKESGSGQEVGSTSPNALALGS
jgi:hypothetical protein